MNDHFQVCSEIIAAYAEARRKHKPMTSLHEGYAIILEELEELWAEIKLYPKHDVALIHKEALHLGAMVLAFILEAEGRDRS